MPAPRFADVDGYIATFPSDVRERLATVRRLIHAVIPDAGETISYQIPTITVGGQPVMYFAGWKRHLALYPVPTFDELLEADVAPLRSATDTVQFQHRVPLPESVITAIVSEIAARAAK